MAEGDTGDRRPFPWRWLLGGLSALVTLSVLVCLWWLASTRDLDVLEARARAAGLALQFPEVDAAADVAWQEFSRKLPSGLYGLPSVQRPSQLSDGEQRVLENPDFIRLVDVELDALPAGHVSPASAGFDELGLLIALRIEQAPPAGIPHLVQGLVNGMARLPAGAEHGGGLIAAGWYLTTALLVRRAAGDLPTDPGMSADLVRLAELIEADVRTGAAERLRRGLELARQGDEAFIRKGQIPVPDPFSIPLIRPVFVRSGRLAYFSALLEWHLAAADATDLAALVDTGRRYRKAHLDVGMVRLLPSSQLGSWGAYRAYSGSIRSPLALRLLAAELAGAPWPRDPFAVPTAPLQRVERDGMLIGAYSVGEDGVDDGGDRRKDLCMPLGGIMGHPRMGDAPIADGTAWK